MGFVYWLMAVVGTVAAIIFWRKKKTWPAIISTVIGVAGIFIVVCSFILRMGID